MSPYKLTGIHNPVAIPFTNRTIPQHFTFFPLIPIFRADSTHSVISSNLNIQEKINFHYTSYKFHNSTQPNPCSNTPTVSNLTTPAYPIKPVSQPNAKTYHRVPTHVSTTNLISSFLLMINAPIFDPFKHIDGLPHR